MSKLKKLRKLLRLWKLWKVGKITKINQNWESVTEKSCETSEAEESMASSG